MFLHRSANLPEGKPLQAEQRALAITLCCSRLESGYTDMSAQRGNKGWGRDLGLDRPSRAAASAATPLAADTTFSAAQHAGCRDGPTFWGRICSKAEHVLNVCFYQKTYTGVYEEHALFTGQAADPHGYLKDLWTAYAVVVSVASASRTTAWVLERVA